MKFLIMGAGAVGSYFGALLAEKGIDVTLVTRGTHLDAIHRKGLYIKSDKRSFRVDIKAVHDPVMAEVPDVVLFSPKSYSTIEAAKDLRPAINENTVVISLQNGIDNVSKLRDILYPDNVLPGIVYIVAAIESPGVVLHSARGEIVFGKEDGTKDEKMEKILKIFQDAKIKASISENIVTDQWKKMLFNVAYNSVTALTNSTIGETVKDKGLNKVLVDLMTEVILVADKIGVSIDKKIIDANLERTAELINISTSMTYDMRHEKPLEIECLNGAVVRLGQEHKIATPVNDLMYACLSIINERFIKKSKKEAK